MSGLKPVAEEEDASQLKLGDDFSRAACLMNAEVAGILEAKREEYETLGLAPSPVFQKFLDYVIRFRHHITPEVAGRVPSMLGCWWHQACVIGNHLPDTVEEARNLVPSLLKEDRSSPLDEEKALRMLDELKTVQSLAQ
eukprot:SM000159S01778  [mRNA]  locus=s159:146327:147833:- [translate_table: standard]